MSLDKSACVPITIDNFPLLRSFLIFNLSLFLVILDKLLILISKSLNLSSNVLKCCSTNIVVGATIATCLPEDATTKDALIATSVLPNPTSPQINLSINLFEYMSFKVSSIAVSWSSVRSKEKLLTNSL